jgi:hypothetical protein
MGLLCLLGQAAEIRLRIHELVVLCGHGLIRDLLQLNGNGWRDTKCCGCLFADPERPYIRTGDLLEEYKPAQVGTIEARVMVARVGETLLCRWLASA